MPQGSSILIHKISSGLLLQLLISNMTNVNPSIKLNFFLDSVCWYFFPHELAWIFYMTWAWPWNLKKKKNNNNKSQGLQDPLAGYLLIVWLTKSAALSIEFSRNFSPKSQDMLPCILSPNAIKQPIQNVNSFSFCKVSLMWSHSMWQSQLYKLSTIDIFEKYL